MKLFVYEESSRKSGKGNVKIRTEGIRKNSMVGTLKTFSISLLNEWTKQQRNEDKKQFLLRNCYSESCLYNLTVKDCDFLKLFYLKQTNKKTNNPHQENEVMFTLEFTMK